MPDKDDSFRANNMKCCWTILKKFYNYTSVSLVCHPPGTIKLQWTVIYGSSKFYRTGPSTVGPYQQTLKQGASGTWLLHPQGCRRTSRRTSWGWSARAWTKHPRWDSNPGTRVAGSGSWASGSVPGSWRPWRTRGRDRGHRTWNTHKL